MDVLGDLVDPERGSDALWIHRPGPRTRSWSGTQFCVDAWKAGNLFRHYGVHEGSTVAILDGPDDPGDDTLGPTSPQALIALFGAWVLGANVRVDPPTDPDARLLVGPTTWLDDYELPPGSKPVGFGREPQDPTVVHFESERWSENPVKFPADVDGSDAALLTDEDSINHHQVLEAAQTVVDTHDIDADDRIALDAPLAHPGTVVAGVIAPLCAGATVTVGDEATLTVADRDGEDVIRPADVRTQSFGRT